MLGEEHVAPMIAFGTLKKKSAFKMYAKAKKLDFELANQISKQIDAYEEAVKNADEEDKDTIDIADYIDAQYIPYLDASKKYWGIINDKKKAPSAYLLYQGNIRREIGLIKCKSESTKKEYITCVIDGAIAENYKFLKNDILKVDVVLLIDKVFKQIGIPHFDVPTLLEKIKDDNDVWSIYRNGYTIGINQVEKTGSKHKCMKYKPTNISELSAFVAAIRPGFKSMYNTFEKREDFSWGIDTLDNMIRTKELPVSFLFFQEQVMSVLNYAGFPMDKCYGIIKAIAKKHPEKVKPLKSQFIDGFQKHVMEDEHIDKETALEYSNRVWQIINDNCSYSFNSAHAYCMAIDSLYQAWQKAHYPLQFYEVLLQHYTDKGNKDKVALLRKEMTEGFGIIDAPYKFRSDHRRFVADEANNTIYPNLSSIKGIGKNVAEDLYYIGEDEFGSFFELLEELVNETTLKKNQIEILIKINFFSEFGKVSDLLNQYNYFLKLYGKRQLKLANLDEYGITKKMLENVGAKFATKIAKIPKSMALLEEVVRSTPTPKDDIVANLRNEIEYIGYIQSVFNVSDNYYFVIKLGGYRGNVATLYQLSTGEQLVAKIKCKNRDIKELTVIKVVDINDERKWGKDSNGDWYRKEETEKIIRNFVNLT